MSSARRAAALSAGRRLGWPRTAQLSWHGGHLHGVATSDYQYAVRPNDLWASSATHSASLRAQVTFDQRKERFSESVQFGFPIVVTNCGPQRRLHSPGAWSSAESSGHYSAGQGPESAPSIEGQGASATTSGMRRGLFLCSREPDTWRKDLQARRWTPRCFGTSTSVVRLGRPPPPRIRPGPADPCMWPERQARQIQTSHSSTRHREDQSSGVAVRR